MHRLIVPISGYAGVGKDTFAKFMVEAQPDFRIVKYADALKDMLAFILDVPRVHMDGPEKVQYRGALQRLGTDVFRIQVDPDHWVAALYDTVLKDPKTRVFLIPDTRFPNEINWWQIRPLIQCLPIRLERHGIVAVNGHVSETALDCYPYWFKKLHFISESLGEMRMQAHELANDLNDLLRQ